MGILKPVDELAFTNYVDAETYVTNLIQTKRVKAYFFVCTVNGDGSEWEQRSFHKSEINQALTYIKKNQHKRIFVPTVLFDKRERVEEQIAQICKILIDVDLYKSSKYKNRQPIEVLEDIQKQFFDSGIIPMANAVTFSGGGIYLEWELKYTPGGRPLVKRRVVAKILFEMLKEYAPDGKSLDAVHVFGLSGTTNWKHGQEAVVKTFKNDLPPYTLSGLARSLPSLWDVWKASKNITIEKEKKYKPEKEEKSGRIFPIHKERTLAHDHIVSVRQLIQVREGDMEGYRESVLFFIRNAYHKMHSKRFYEGDPQLFYESYKLALEINETFTTPLKELEIRKNTLNTKKLYRFKTETIIEWFDITLDEQIQLKVKTADAKREKSKRQMRELKGIKKENTHEYKEQVILEYFNQHPGASLKGATKALGFSYNTVKKYAPKI